MNLISVRTEKDSDQIHFADCIMGSQLIFRQTKVSDIYDVGSGNGFPGLIMAILAPEKKLVLVDKDAKKIEFLKLCTDRLNLKNVEIKQSRFEDLTPCFIKCAVSRGFAPLSKIAPLLEKVGFCGEFYHFKSKNWVAETQQIPVQTYSIWSPELIGEYKLPNKGPTLAIIATNNE